MGEKERRWAVKLVEFLQYAGTSVGINAIVGFVLSFVVEWFPNYEALSSKWKRVAMMGLCFTVPVLAFVGLVVLGEQTLGAEAVWMALSAGFAAFFGSQAAQTRQLEDWDTLDVEALTEEVVARAVAKIAQSRLQQDATALFGVDELAVGQDLAQ